MSTRRIVAFGLLCATQALPVGFAAFAVPVLLRQSGVSLEAIGFAGLLFWPTTISFLWGPWVDRLAASQRLRGVAAALHVAVAMSVLALTVVSPRSSLAGFVVILGAIIVLSSVLGVLTHGLMIWTMQPAERAAGGTATYGGYYLGSIVGGGVFLTAEASLGWAPALIALAGLTLSGAAAFTLVDATTVTATDAAPRTALALIRGIGRREVWQACLLLVLLDLPQNIGVALIGPALIDSQLSQSQAGIVSGILGLSAALAGAIVAGAVAARLDRRKALAVFGFIQLTPLVLLALTLRPGVTMLTAAIVVMVTYAAAGAFNVVLSAWLMDRAGTSSQRTTDLSILSAGHTTTYVMADPLAGTMMAGLGRPAFFMSIFAAGALALYAAVRLVRRTEPLSTSPSIVAA